MHLVRNLHLLSLLLCRSFAFTPVSPQDPTRYRHSCLLLSSRPQHLEDAQQQQEDGPAPQDTIRVRIWRALAPGTELSLKDLGAAVGHHKQGELKSHLKHVDKQARTLRNKSNAWRERRGLDPTTDKVCLVTRKTKNGVFFRLK